MIDPDRDDLDSTCDEWFYRAAHCPEDWRRTRQKAGTKAFVGRVVVDNEKKYRYTAPEAYNRFLYKTSSREAL